VIAILLSVMVSVMVVFGVAWKTDRPAEATPQAPSDICVTLVVNACVQATVRVTVTSRVTLPRVTEIVTLPPVVRTIIRPSTVNLPPVTRTQTVTRTAPVTNTVPGLPRATETATVVVSREVISNGTAPPITREVRSTVSASGQPIGQNTSPTVTVTPSKEVVRLPGTTKEVTKFQAVGLSLLALLALMGLGLFLLWLGFVLGYRSADRENTNFLRALRDTIRRPGKHE
jgi:hypothetical protein